MNPLLPDDPRLTAYALGELDESERPAIEAAIAAQPELHTRVTEIRAMAAQLESALAAEPVLDTGVAEAGVPARLAIIPEKDLGKLAGGESFWETIRFPQAYFIVGGLAAACFAVVVAWYDPPVQVVPVLKRYVQVDLPENAAVVEPAEVAAALAQVELAPPPAALAAPAVRAPKMASSGFQAHELFPQSAVKPLLDVAGKAGARTGNGLAADNGQPGVVTFSGVGQGGQKDLKAAGALESKGMRLAAARKEREEQIRYNSARRQFGQDRLAMGTAVAGMTPRVEFNRESYGERRDNEFIAVDREPLSTFSIDVDTASYANVRRFLRSGQLPPAAAVRVEELVNYFPYRYPSPELRGVVPFAASLEVASAPWAPGHRLVRIGLKGREATQAARPAANLVFLIDVSGSMNGPNRLPLVKESLHLLLGKLRNDDRVALVTYAGQSGLALPSTSVAEAAKIRAALDELSPSGSTNGAMGIHLAYDIARANFVPGGVNRVLLCTDGDFNVGVTDRNELVHLIQKKAKTNVFLTVLGFGMGNLKDGTLESLADKGNGQYGYIDSRREAEKLLVEQVSGTLVTIAKDVKIQVEFNPAQVSSYRLLGYENRLLNKQDFNNDAVDAGEIGAGHTVTALYEVVPAGTERIEAEGGRIEVDALKYQKVGIAEARSQKSENNPQSAIRDPQSDELLTVKIRYKDPAGDMSRKLEFPLVDRGADFEEASGDFKFAAAVAGFGLALRSDPAKGALLADVTRWADAGLGDDPGGYRTEFAGLVRQAQMLAP